MENEKENAQMNREKNVLDPELASMSLGKLFKVQSELIGEDTLSHRQLPEWKYPTESR